MKTASPTNRVDKAMRAAGATDGVDAVFAEPWEARAFALAVTLSRSGQFSWDEFRERLIEEIAQADAAEVRDADAAEVRDADAAEIRGGYYECWLAALEQLLREKALLNLDEIEGRAAAIAASPPARTKAKSRGPLKIA
jgi:nitrile hydratase accessory protein